MWPEVSDVHVALAQMKSKGPVEDKKEKMKLLLLSLKGKSRDWCPAPTGSGSGGESWVGPTPEAVLMSSIS